MWLGLGIRITNWWRTLVADAPFNNHTTLLDGLVSYWKLDERSGTRYDSIDNSANDLTDNNTVTFVHAGPSEVVAKFTTANNESLSVATPVSVQKNSARSVGLWVYMSGADGTLRGIASCEDSSVGGNPIWLLQRNAETTVRLYLSTAYVATATTGTGWHYIFYRHNGTSGAWSLNVDTVEVASGSKADTAGGTDDYLWIGSGYQFSFDDKIARVGIWSSNTITSAVETSIYNLGAGKSYDELTDDEKVSLVSYWNLDEASGTRADSHGSSTLTDNNTVTSLVNDAPPPKSTAAFFTAGTSEYLSKASSAAFPYATGDLTVALWVKTPAAGLTTGQALLDYGTFGVGHNWEMRATGVNTIGFDVWDAAPSRIASAATVVGAVTNSAWHLIVATVNNATKTVTVYCDNSAGTPASWTSQTPAGAARPFTISSYSGSSSYWDGAVDEAGIWSRVLTAQERSDLWNSGSGLYYGDTGLDTTIYNLLLEGGDDILLEDGVSFLLKN